MTKPKKTRLHYKEMARNLLPKSARPHLFFYLLMWLMALLVAGTISEKYLGLYQSQKLFFSSFLIWLGGVIPVPGGYLTLTLIFFNLLSKLIQERWTKPKIGTIIVHCGALLLLFGGFLTANFSSEGNMVIPEGASSNYMADYHRSELALTDENFRDISLTDEKLLKPGYELDLSPTRIRIHRYYENISIAQRPEPLTDGGTHGLLVANEMNPAPLAPEDEKNHPGIIFNLSGAGKKTDGQYAIFEDMPIEQHLDINGKKYLVTLRHKRTTLPFEIKLLKFEKQLYPGTDKPRGFQSEVVLTDGPVQWHSLISMNQPLRYKGYTFYQSSFIDGDGKPATVLAVVKNIGALFPYIASITICIGLLVHLFRRIPKLKKPARA